MFYADRVQETTTTGIGTITLAMVVAQFATDINAQPSLASAVTLHDTAAVDNFYNASSRTTGQAFNAARSRRVRRLATDCRVPHGFTPSESTPFNLDFCTINNGDDITELLKDIGNAYGAVYVRAPSKDLSVVAQTTQWKSDTVTPIKTFVFLEDESASNTLTINHFVPDINATYTIPYEGVVYKGATLWTFEDHTYIKIGGPNLKMTFVGTHPGLGTGDYITTPYVSPTPQYHENMGFIEARMVDGSSPDLFDVRANIRFTHRYSIYTYNGQGEPTPGDSAYRIKQFNVSGTHYATSGVFFHQGVKNAWGDPDNLLVTDPYVRGSGWTGIVPGPTQGGLPLGCNDQSRDQVRFASFDGYYTDSITGGVKIEYGIQNWVMRYSNAIGTSVNDPFVVKIKDWGVSGPGTAYPAGVRVKKTTEAVFMKGDPHDAGADALRRFVRYEKLTDTYGSGPGYDAFVGCTPSNNTFDGPSNFIRLENNVPGRCNRGWHIELKGDWDTNFIRGQLFQFGGVAGDADTARIYGNTLAAASGTTITDTITMFDTDTVTGPGTFTNIQVSNHNATTIGRANTITDVVIAGAVTIDADTETTTIANVRFTESPRAIVTVGSGSTVVVNNICAPDGCTITGAGTLTYDGVGQSLPYTITGATGCSGI